ncbi:hypothetical protein E2562_016746 [Oryza meyeriana var. granulata]|uniref:DUF4219 domain-containing protein n=1 Tax=Oryza meyeriana var. granulata TaxID=110450 RepID=A0A6G1BWS9_9ORYZ|nr:hypothetical protein E2562_016746 [Oryza meyeriana var. granulata]
MATSEKFDTRAPFFDGTDYDYWKSRMTNYLKGKSLKLWKITQNDTYLPDEELEVLDDDQLVLLSNKFKRVYENRRNRRRADGCFNCEGSSDSSDSDAEDEAPKKKTDGLCFIADADVDGGICTMALEDDAATDNNNNDKSSDDEPKLVTHSLPEMQVTYGAYP